MLNKKAQSAMEYLMTYGWAILVVLIALGALFYLGVFSPRTPNSCIGIAPITCTDVKADASLDNVTLILGSSATSARVTGITVNGISNSTGGCVLSGQTIPTITPGSIALDCSATLTDEFSENDKFSGLAYIEFVLTSGGETHTQTVSISGTVEA